MFKKIDHVEIVTDQLDRAVQFYTDVLGFKLRARERIDRSTLGVSLDLAYLDLCLISLERHRAALDPLDRLFLRLHLQNPEASYQLFGFSKRTVDDGATVAREFNAGTFRARL